MLLNDVARVSAEVAETSSRLAKTARLTECLAGARAEEVRLAVAYLSGLLPQGTIGVGWAALRELPRPAAAPALELLEVDAALSAIAAMTGGGSQSRRREALADLFGRATAAEQAFLRGLLLGELRQGALEGVMTDVVARTAGIALADVRRALMVSGDLPAVAEAAIAGGPDALSAFRLTVLRPVQPMLAQTADDVHAALERIRPASVEWKLDGARIQAHRLGDEVRLYTRNLADITDRAPEIVAAVRELPVDAVILDGEAIALREDGRPLPFQVTMSRFGTRATVERQRTDVPLSPFFFDCLHLDGADLVDRSASERVAMLDRAAFRGDARSSRGGDRGAARRSASSTTRSHAVTRASW